MCHTVSLSSFQVPEATAHHLLQQLAEGLRVLRAQNLVHREWPDLLEGWMGVARAGGYDSRDGWLWLELIQ